MFASRITTLGSGEGVRFAPTLHARWVTQPTEDGSSLTPFPTERASTPAALPVGEDFSFTLDDAGLDPVGLELAVSVRDPGAPSSEGALFRSGTLTALPGSLPENPNGFIAIAFADSTQSTGDVNTAVAARFAGGPVATADPAITVTGVSLTENPNRPTSWLMTVFGAYTGSNPIPGLQTLFFRYSAEFTIAPVADPFDATSLVSVSLGAPGVVFSDAPGGNPLTTLLDSFVAGFLTQASPAVSAMMQDTVESALEGLIEAEIRGRVSTALAIPANADGSPGPLPPQVTISLQSCTISNDVLTTLATAGSFGPLRTTPVTVRTGCATVIGTLVLAGGAATALLWA